MLGQQFRIVGDPTGRTYTCEDRGWGGWWWVDIWFLTLEEGRAWRGNFGQPVTLELLP